MCLLDVNVHVNYYFTTHKEIKKNIFIKKNVSFWTQRDSNSKVVISSNLDTLVGNMCDFGDQSKAEDF